MNINEAYLKFIQKVNKNFTNDNIVVDKARFILIYNEAQNKFIEWILEKRNEDDIRYVQELLVNDKKLTFSNEVLNHQDFKLPENYFSFSNLQAYAKKGDCKSTKINTFEVKSENIHELLQDEMNKPSFKFRETFYTIAGGEVKIYTDDFDISKVYLTYYRYPRQVDIEGYVRADGTFSSNINPEMDDRVVDRVISAATKEFNINDENLQKFQFDRDRVFTKL